jgi:hypothetical protein
MDNIAILKYTVMIASAPIWWPFVKTLWDDLKMALREEGGLFGEAPHPRKLEEIRREKELEQSNMVHEPRIRPGQRSGFGGQRAGGAAGARPGATGGAPLKQAGGAGGRRSGFR